MPTTFILRQLKRHVEQYHLLPPLIWHRRGDGDEVEAQTPSGSTLSFTIENNQIVWKEEFPGQPHAGTGRIPLPQKEKAPLD